ncbi:hypothetical protein ACMATS_06990 [Streptoverticillium reticulum]|uniref:hypothetical protein n=1 Tax=Streptoverticillium reticulum TaxID=1433415 RepID=UPI0039BFEF2C
MRSFSRLLTVGSVMTVAAVAGSADAIAADTPPHTVETFQYPQADKIFKERGILLKSGDGHITLVTCDSRPDLIEVSASGMSQLDPVGNGRYCFRVTGKSGYLSLQLPRVYGAKGNNYDVNVHMQTDSEDKSFALDKNTWTSVGKTTDPQGRDFSLLEINAKK